MKFKRFLLFFPSLLRSFMFFIFFMFVNIFSCSTHSFFTNFDRVFSGPFVLAWFFRSTRKTQQQKKKIIILCCSNMPNEFKLGLATHQKVFGYIYAFSIQRCFKITHLILSINFYKELQHHTWMNPHTLHTIQHTINFFRHFTSKFKVIDDPSSFWYFYSLFLHFTIFVSLFLSLVTRIECNVKFNKSHRYDFTWGKDFDIA